MRQQQSWVKAWASERAGKPKGVPRSSHWHESVFRVFLPEHWELCHGSLALQCFQQFSWALGPLRSQSCSCWESLQMLPEVCPSPHQRCHQRCAPLLTEKVDKALFRLSFTSWGILSSLPLATALREHGISRGLKSVWESASLCLVTLSH